MKENLLFLFRKLYEREKITIEEYHKAVKIIINEEYEIPKKG